FRAYFYSITEREPGIGRVFPGPGTSSYPCAACPFGQAISTALVGEDRTNPAVARPVAGDFKQGKEYSNPKDSSVVRSARARQFQLLGCGRCLRTERESRGKKLEWACRSMQSKKLKN